MGLLVNSVFSAVIAAIVGYASNRFRERRDERRKAKVVVPARLRLARRLIDVRLKTLNRALEPRASPELPQIFHLPFSTERLANLEDEAFSYFSERQHMALQNVAFYLESADERNRAAIQTKIHSERVQFMNDERNLLQHGGELIDAYLSGQLSDTGGVVEPPSASV